MTVSFDMLLRYLLLKINLIEYFFKIIRKFKLKMNFLVRDILKYIKLFTFSVNEIKLRKYIYFQMFIKMLDEHLLLNINETWQWRVTASFNILYFYVLNLFQETSVELAFVKMYICYKYVICVSVIKIKFHICLILW